MNVSERALSVIIILLVGQGRQPPVSSAQAVATTTGASASGDRIAIYKPGVAINWTRRQVELSGRVCLREGMLELFACGTGADGSAKTHESIVLLQGRPRDVYEALGLIGLEPGRPPRWDPVANKVEPATGQRLELRVEWLDDGRRRQVDVSEWMQPNEDPNRVLGPLPWVFAGSRVQPGGGILADEDGTIATVVDFDGAIIALAASHSADNAQLWLAARPSRIPPVNTPCTVIVRAAGLWLEMDRFGRVSIEGRRLTREVLVDEVRRYLKTAPKGVVRVLVAPTASESDVQALRGWLRSAGAPDAAIQVERQPESAFPAHDPQVGRAFLRSRLPLKDSFVESVRSEHSRLVDQLEQRRSAFERQASAVAEYVAWLEEGLSRLAGRTSSPASSAPATGLAPMRSATTTSGAEPSPSVR